MWQNSRKSRKIKTCKNRQTCGGHEGNARESAESGEYSFLWTILETQAQSQNPGFVRRPKMLSFISNTWLSDEYDYHSMGSKKYCFVSPLHQSFG